MKKLLFAGLLLAGAPSFADGYAGLWKTIDDVKKKESSHVRITEKGGEYFAVVEKILVPKEERGGDFCDLCTDERKGKPIEGLTIMSGMRAKGGELHGGRILDPENGKEYKCRMRLSADGKELTVRGFIGISLIGRSQTWHRVSE